MFAYFLFFFYLICGTLLLHGIIRRKIFPFTIYHTASIVLFKVFMGCLYGWLFLHFYGGDDTWNYFIESKAETTLLLHHPKQFFQEFIPSFSLRLSDNDPLQAFRFYVVHFEKWFLVKALAVLNLFSGRNYYIDVLLFELLLIWGPLLLFKLLAQIFPLRTGLHFLLIFFIPSVIFWCSGIRAEALLLLFIALILYNSHAYAKNGGVFRICGIVTGLLGLLLIRFQFLIVFIPAYLALLISLRNREPGPKYFNRIFLGCSLIILLSLFLPLPLQLSRPAIEAQQKFFMLNGNTRYGLDTLRPGPVSFIHILPQAVANSIFRPTPWEGKNLLQSLSSVEVLFLIAGLINFFLSARRKEQISHPVYWFFLFYALSQLVLIGIVVPFPGAIVRYRIISMLFLFLFFYATNPLLHEKLNARIFRLH